MSQPPELSAILERIVNGEHSEADLRVLKDFLTQGDRIPSLFQVGKYSVNIQQALGQVHIGDRLELTEENIQAIIQAIRAEISNSAPSQPTEVASADELVQQVRSRIREDIQRLHGTMPLWGVDHWVPLGELFVDVNILEEVSSNRRSEIADLWQDFSQNPGYRSLDRIGLGKEQQRVSGLSVLDRNTNLMVVGKPGSGKTTYLQRLVTECNTGNLQAHRIPVLIRLREFVEDGREVGYSIEQYLEQCWRLSDQAVRLVLGEGRSLVLLDGLDEVRGTDGQAIVKQIKQFARVYPQVQVILTSRMQSQKSRFERFNYVEVADFNEPQVRIFAKHWFQTVCGDLNTGQAKATMFLKQLFREGNKPIRELAITPILLSLTCVVFQQTGKFYSKRSKLYEEGVELFLEVWDSSRAVERDGIYRNLSTDKKLELLSYLAVKRFYEAQYVLYEQAELEKHIAEFLKIGKRESRCVLEAIAAQHGLLIERSRKVWSFSHLTFQEYLVAHWLCRCQSWEKAMCNIIHPHWYTVFTLGLDMTTDVGNFLNSMNTEVNNLVIKEDKIQTLFLCISSLASALDEVFLYKKSAIRAYYLYLFVGRQNVGVGYKPAHTIIDKHFQTYNFLPSHNRQSYELALDWGLTNFIEDVTSIPIERWLNNIEKQGLSRILNIDEYDLNDQILSHALKADLRNWLSSLLTLKEESIYDSTESLQETWKTKRFIEKRKLKLLLRKHIYGFQEELNQHQEELLSTYYQSICFLLYCINASSNLNEAERSNLEKGLVMPTLKNNDSVSIKPTL